MNIIKVVTVWLALGVTLFAQQVDSIAGKKVVFLGDSITQGGGYVSFTAYYLDKLYPQSNFDIYSLGLSSETLSGLTEEGHPFPRPCLFERLGRVLDKVKPEILFACYGMNDGIYKPLESARFAAFRSGVTNLIRQCQTAGVKEILMITPPIYDFSPRKAEFNYDTVLAEYAAWEKSLQWSGVRVIDLHTAMRKARDKRTEVFSKDRIHPGEEGHLFMARTILTAMGARFDEEKVEVVKADPLFKLVDEKRRLRSSNWMAYIGYTREKTVSPQPLANTEANAAKLQEKIDALRRQK